MNTEENLELPVLKDPVTGPQLFTGDTNITRMTIIYKNKLMVCTITPTYVFEIKPNTEEKENGKTKPILVQMVLLKY